MDARCPSCDAEISFGYRGSRSATNEAHHGCRSWAEGGEWVCHAYRNVLIARYRPSARDMEPDELFLEKSGLPPRPPSPEGLTPKSLLILASFILVLAARRT